MNEADLRLAIVRGRRITRDPGLLAIIDELERRLNERPFIRRRGNREPDTDQDARLKKAMYMKLFMRRYRAKKKAAAQQQEQS